MVHASTCVIVEYYKARGEFGEHEREIRIARCSTESNSSLYSPNFQVLRSHWRRRRRYLDSRELSPRSYTSFFITDIYNNPKQSLVSKFFFGITLESMKSCDILDLLLERAFPFTRSLIANFSTFMAVSCLAFIRFNFPPHCEINLHCMPSTVPKSNKRLCKLDFHW